MNISFSKENLREMPNKREKLIFALTLFVFIVVFFRTCWVPSHKVITEVKSELQEVTQEREALGDVPDNPSLERENVPQKIEIPKNYVKWANRFTDNPDGILMVELSNPATIRDVKMNGIELSDVSGSDGIVGRKFKLSLYGPFSSVGAYLERLENLPIIMIIDSIAINVVAGGQGRVNAEVNGAAYGWK